MTDDDNGRQEAERKILAESLRKRLGSEQAAEHLPDTEKPDDASTPTSREKYTVPTEGVTK